MKRYTTALLIWFATLFWGEAGAQYNKAYFFWMGRGMLIDNRYQDAIETLNILLRVDQTAYEGYFLRGIAKYNLDDLLGAEADFTAAIEQNSVFTTAYQYRAITRSRLGNYDDALSDFREAIELRPDLPGPYYSRGVTYLLSQQYDKAVADFDMFIRQEDKVADAYLNRGTAYLHLKDTVRAYENFEQGIRTNREYPNGYNHRGTLLMEQERWEEAIADFDMALHHDSTYLPAYFNRAIINARRNRPVEAIADLDRVIALDSTSSVSYFNRAIIKSQIGDYNNALDDYNKVAFYSPGNVLLYYNRAALYVRLGDPFHAIEDYTKAIELYPDFANAYLNRAQVKYQIHDPKGARQDHQIAERKIAEYKSKLSDSTFSVYADTSRKFNQLLSFESNVGGSRTQNLASASAGSFSMMPLFKFTFSAAVADPARLTGYRPQRMVDFRNLFEEENLVFSCRESDIPADSLVVLDRRYAEALRSQEGETQWQQLFRRAVTQSLIKQYTNSVNTYTRAIEMNPTNPFLYINRSTTTSEMIDFISSIDNGYQHINIESDPVGRLRHTSSRVYNYDEAIADLNKAAKLYPEFAYIYYNRATLLALSGQLPEAFDDYTRAIELHPAFAEAYFNRGLIQIYMKDTRKGCLDMSKAGELGLSEAYRVLKAYSPADY